MTDPDSAIVLYRANTEAEFHEIAATITSRRPAHIFITMPFRQARPQFTRLSREYKIAAAYVLEVDEVVESAASEIDWVPIFHVKDIAEAAALVGQFRIDSAQQVVMRAINGEEIAVQYLSGNPS
ncbi:MAG: hypothetical protein ACREX3_01175 [Gammaproteobacteria bacterium]